MKNCKIFQLQTTNIPEYHISISPDYSTSFEEQLDSIVLKYTNLLDELKLSKERLLFAKIFLSDYINQQPIIDQHMGFTTIIEGCVVSTIEQPPLDGTKINVLLYFIDSDKLSIKKEHDTYFIQVDNKEYIYQSISQFEESFTRPYHQTLIAFNQHNDLIDKNQMSIRDHCVRTWIYSRDVDKDYMDIVKARNNIFESFGLTKKGHYIASTGIEGRNLYPKSCVKIEFLSYKQAHPEQIKYLQALNYLNNTVEYGVAFERGTAIRYQDKQHIFISGTASIDRKGDCIYRNNVLKQAERLFLNIKQLLKDGDAELKDIAQMIVYLRNISDYKIINEYLDIHFPTIPRVIVQGRVCRPEWLIEVECFAVTRIY